MTDEELPTMLAEIGLSSMKLDDGSEVTIKQTYGASITNGTMALWTIVRRLTHGYARTAMAISSRNTSPVNSAWERTKVEQFQSHCRKERLSAGTEHLCPFIRPYVPLSRSVVKLVTSSPWSLFGAYVGQKAIIKRSK